ncbi:MAG: hypothetical protein O7G85_15930 [Planctomycetota bacterium]|nr:hypothetical protein [Planctomycetota bacterium]
MWKISILALALTLPLLMGFTSDKSGELVNLIHFQIEQGKQIVAIGERHQHKSFHTLLGNALSSKQTQEDIDVIVVEFGNSFYQDELDSYINGEDISVDAIRVVWRNTVISPNTVWDSPVYERFFKTVRDINRTLRPERRYRVIAGGKSIDRAAIQSAEDYEPYKASLRSQHIYEVVEAEVLLKGKKALLIAGGHHVTKISAEVGRNGRSIRSETTGSLLELNYPNSTFFINVYSKLASLGIAEIKDIENGSIILSEEPWLGGIKAGEVASFFTYEDFKLKDMADAVLHWGPEEHWVYEIPLSATYKDDDYWEELNRRSLIRRNRKMDESLRD